MNENSTQDISTDEDGQSNTNPDPAVVAGLAKEVVDLNTVTPDTDMEDLAAFREVFADRRIVGLGEAAHGAREFSRLKHRFLRFLVKEIGVRLVGLEANFTETLAVNRYVRRGDGDPEVALDGIYVWMWNTQEMLAVVEWLRAFNADRAPEDQVRFYGFDIQHTKGVADAVTDYLNRVDPKYLATVREDLAVLADPGLRLQDANGRDGRLAAASRVVPDLRASFEEHRADYVARSSEPAWELARQHVTVLGQATKFGKTVHTADGRFNEESLRVRDRAMAENVAWILEHESAECIAVWAHNDHINRVKTTSGGYSVPSMGRHFTKWYGDAYYALGFEFGGGAFQAFVESEDENWDYEVQECRLNGPLSDTVASAFATLDRPLTFLNFRTAKTDPRLMEWLDGEHQLHSVGGAYDPERPEKHVQPYVLAAAFDGLCYVNETTQARLNI